MKLELLLEISMVHLVFHVLMLQKFVDDPSSIVSLDDVCVEENLTCEEVPIDILD